MRVWALVAGGAVALGAATTFARLPPVDDEFDHPEHAGLFPTCVSCHEGAVDPQQSLWPDLTSCATCHDGDVEETVDWVPPTEPPHTNLRFSHEEHAAELASEGHDPATCVGCHADPDTEWMSVQLAAVPQCLECHGIAAEHLATPDSVCAACHLPLPQATRLTHADVAEFSVPPSHDEAGFDARGGHGLLAYRPLGVVAPDSVAASCATCHARDFCIQCHVDSFEQPSLRAIEPDERSLAISAELSEPETHEQGNFLAQHGFIATANPMECQTCHTQESCLACHIATPEVAVEIYASAPGRAAGAQIVRSPPISHQGAFGDGHGNDAAAGPATCAGCHARQDCLDCHRPTAAQGPLGYHTSDFLQRHPAVAYTRGTSCTDCHNPGEFCLSCHAASGIVSAGLPLNSGYHDGQQAFSVGHGQAARQSLESCVACHQERDCLTCHSAIRGRGFSPHGPGFEAERLREKNPEMCVACHGGTIPNSE